jgi:D-arginine dehydrogenase
MLIGTHGEEALLARAAAEGAALVPSVRAIDAAEVLRRVPALRPGWVAGGVAEPDAMDIDTHAMLSGFLRALRARGGQLRTDAEVLGLSRDGGAWRIALGSGEILADVVVAAGGAWCDTLGAMAGASPIGLVPKRRTAFLVDPDAGKLLCSPADETPSPPCDAQPEDLDVAIAADRIQTAAEIPIARIARRWAGLRSFVADKTPVAGYDPHVAGFFWLAGQGGYGFQTTPAMALAAAALVDRRDLPAMLGNRGVTAAALSPARFARV